VFVGPARRRRPRTCEWLSEPFRRRYPRRCRPPPGRAKETVMREHVAERAAHGAGAAPSVRDQRRGAAGTSGGALWAVVLAGGQGVRLRPLIRHIHGDERPKQFASLIGSRTLLRQTIDRISPLVSSERTVAVIHRSHAPYLADALGGVELRHVLRQPE